MNVPKDECETAREGDKTPEGMESNGIVKNIVENANKWRIGRIKSSTDAR